MQANTGIGLPNRPALEPPGGAVPLHSPFYIERATDALFYAGIARRDSLLLLKGARQMGKTSLLARGLQQARQQGWKIILTDLQKFNSATLENSELFYQSLIFSIADQLDLEIPVLEPSGRRGPAVQFEDYLCRRVLSSGARHVVWAIDEVDRLFTANFASEFFGLLRSIDNQRSVEGPSLSGRLTMAIAYATEAHLFITDLNLSPFNVGTRLTLEPFTPEEVAELNRRHGAPLRTPAELEKFYRWVGGQPFLVRRSLYELATKGGDLSHLTHQARNDEGIFSDHLRRMLVLLRKDRGLMEIVRGVLRGEPLVNAESFLRLRKVGLFKGATPTDAQVSCEVYLEYFKRHLC